MKMARFRLLSEMHISLKLSLNTRIMLSQMKNILLQMPFMYHTQISCMHYTLLQCFCKVQRISIECSFHLNQAHKTLS